MLAQNVIVFDDIYANPKIKQRYKVAQAETVEDMKLLQDAGWKLETKNGIVEADFLSDFYYVKIVRGKTERSIGDWAYIRSNQAVEILLDLWEKAQGSEENV